LLVGRLGRAAVGDPSRRTEITENALPIPSSGEALWGSQLQERLAAWARTRWLAWSLFAGLVLLALGLNTWGLSRAGYGDTYYAAAVRSMTMSWKNFFFGAFDPGGFITVDKPPAFLWIGALSARIFGYSTWSILLPSAIAGATSVGLLWFIVRRWFGLTAATIAGLVLALSPISVAVNRLNEPEPFLMLLLIGAAGSLLQSLESRRWWAWTALAGFLVGVAFNTKMGAGWIPGPAFALALVVAVPIISRTSIRRLGGRLAVLAAVTLIVSASWMTIVDAWPASDRPYVGGSTDNTVLNLALGYDGFGRVNGTNQGPGGGGVPRPAIGFGAGQPPTGGGFSGRGRAPGVRPNGGFVPGGRGVPPGGQAPSGGQGAQGNSLGAGGVIAGAPGLLRMFDPANGGQIGWLLPFALGAGFIALWTWRRDPRRRAFAVLFLGWVILYGMVFSYAQGIYHSYYTASMAPGVAVLVGIGAVALVQAVRRDPLWLMAAAGLIGMTVLIQFHIEGRVPDFYGWLRPLVVMTALGGVALMVFLASRRLPVTAGLALAVAGLLLLPGAWSLSEAANAPLNTTLPQAGPRQGTSGQTFGSNAFDTGTAQLAAWLKSHTDPNARWQLVVANAQSASTLIAEDQVSVMALGGFLGTDNTISVSGFADLVASGDVRYVEVGGLGPRGGGGRFGAFGTTSASGVVMSAVLSACTPVTTNSGLPVGNQGSIYDCAGQAVAIRGLAS
jgi:4-amino-4-deoxy-L-arabinose transferase-like glycosyltransferase